MTHITLPKGVPGPRGLATRTPDDPELYRERAAGPLGSSHQG